MEIHINRVKKIVDFIRKDINRLWQAGAIHIAISRWLVKAIGIIQRIILAQILGAANIGHIAVVSAVMKLIEKPASVGMPTSTTKFVAEATGRIDDQKMVLTTGLWTTFAVSILVAISAYLIIKTTHVVSDEIAERLLSVYLFFLPIIVLTQVYRSYLAGQRKMRFISKFDSFMPFCTCILLVCFCYVWGVDGWLAAHTGMAVTSLLLLIVLVGTKLRLVWNYRIAIRMLRIGVFAVLGQSTWLLLSQFDTLCISSIMKDAVATGTYNTAAMAASQLTMVMGGISFTIFPKIAQNSRDLTKVKKLYKEVTVKVFWVTSVVSVVAWLLAPFFFPLFGREFTASVMPFRILAFGAVFSAQAILANVFLDALGRTDIHFVVGLLAAIGNVVLNLLFIPRWGGSGAAWATLCSLLVSLILRELALYYFIFIKEAVK